MALTITRTEPFRGEWVFTAAKDGEELGVYNDYDKALGAFKAADRPHVQLIVINPSRASRWGF